MNATIDLDAYLSRIGYDGPRTPTLETLKTIHLLHPQAIPFENLDPLLNRPVRLDAESLQRKLIRERRGGYCFEHNLLLSHALTQLGFKLNPLSARVLWMLPPGATLPRTHMLLGVEVGGSHQIVDVGFGGQTLTGPIPLDLMAELPTPHEPFRLLPDRQRSYQLQSLIRGQWKPLYRFDFQEQILADYEASSWYVSTHPQSIFTNDLIASRVEPGRRLALHNADFAIHNLGGETERRTLADPAELKSTLETVFGIALPDDPALDTLLARVCRPAT